MIVVDSNVLLDVLGVESEWRKWSIYAIDRAAAESELAINPVIYAEIAPRFQSSTSLDQFIVTSGLRLEEFTREALYMAGVAHRRYRQAGGKRDRVLPDFMIGAQASVMRWPILTRDPRPYRTYFSDVRLISPDTTP